MIRSGGGLERPADEAAVSTDGMSEEQRKIRVVLAAHEDSHVVDPQSALRTCEPTRIRGDLSFPYARLADGRLVEIDRYDGTSSVTCLGCGSPMHARGGLGRVRRHFAHRVRVEGRCSYESALHAAAKQAIYDGFTIARGRRLPYRLLWNCQACETRRDTDLTRFCDRLVSEVEVVGGVVSDLVFEGARRLAVEVVVTHEPEPSTLSRYKAAKMPVFEITPNWDMISGLAHCIPSSSSHFVRSDKCPECMRRRNVREVERRERRLILGSIDEFLSRLPAAAPPHSWETDCRGNTLYPRLAARLFEISRRLCAAGFRQSLKKPWLFLISISGVGAFFANMGGTEEVPIWEDPTPLYHWKLNNPGSPHAEQIVLLVGRYLGARGIHVRKSFLAHY